MDDDRLYLNEARRLGDVLRHSRAPTDGEVEACVSQLRGCSAFPNMDDLALRSIAGRLVGRDFRAGELLFQQNGEASSLFVLTSGRVQIFLPWGDEELPLVVVEPGELFGEAEYFESSARGSSARALDDIHVYELSFSDLPELFSEVPDLYPNFVAQRLSETSKRFRQSMERSRVVERSLRQLNEFLDLSDMSVLDEGSEGLIQRIVHMASKVMKADRASLFLVDPETGDLWSKVALGEGSRTIIVPRGKGLAGVALANDELLCIEDVYDDPRFNRDTDLATGYRTKSMLCGPIKNARGVCVGVIQVINKIVGSFNEEDISLFKAFSHQAAVAVENFHLFNRLRLSNERMRVMLDVLNAVTGSQNVAALIGKVIEKTITIMQCERASFFVHDRSRRELWSLKAVGDGLEEIRFPADSGIGGHCARHAEIVNVRDAYADPRFNREIDQKTGFRTRNLLAAPVRDRDGEVIGVVEAINKIEGVFEVTEEDLLQAIASQIGEALKKAALLEDLKKTNVGLTNNNLVLEAKINERTEELHRANSILTSNNVELKRLIEKKSEFLGIFAHDLRNPLANISQLADILKENHANRSAGVILEPEQEAEFVEMIRHSASAMLGSLEELMNTESLDSGEIAVNPKPFNVAELFHRIVDFNFPTAEKKSIFLSRTIDEGPFMIVADPDRVREIFDNLISNAIKYSPPGKRVWVTLVRVQGGEERLRFSVKDEGPGLQASDLKAVFGKFKKLSARPTGGEGSSGLGLYIVKKLTELHGGSCWVESIHGQGATFYAELPVGVQPQAGSPVA